MNAQTLPLTELLEGRKQFIIPIFQRTYSWDLKNCQQLWDDILRVGKNSALDTHFVGSVVYIPEEDTSAAISRWLVIDGQQRITTITLLLLALKNHLLAHKLDKPDDPELIEESYLKNRKRTGEQAYKMLLTRTDKATLIALLDNREPEEKHSYRILENFQLFKKLIAGADLSVVWQGIKKLKIVDVCLQQGIDNPQMIFESMNSTGKALTQADLIRNFVLMGLEHDLQTRLYEDYWRPMEIEFGAERYISDFDDFMRYYLVIHTKNHRIRKGDVYDEFKAYSRNLDVEALLVTLKEFATYYCHIALGSEKDEQLGAAFHDIRELRADVTYPFLMEVYHDMENELLDKAAFIQIVRMVESYVFRRAVCDIPTNSLRQTFATFSHQLKKDRYLESVCASFLLYPSYRRFPKDDEFEQKIQTRNLYKFNRRSYWLRRFENFGRKERVYVQDYTIEHIMPQNENLSSEWKVELGENWKQLHEQYLHTLGNLTLTGYNSEYSDHPFATKRDMEGGLKESPLKLNQNLGGCLKWDEEAITTRAKSLAQRAKSIWEVPQIADDILDAYRPKTDATQDYSINDHPHLLHAPTKELFEALRTELIALDECIKEEFLKLYVAYKAETNFVDIIPKATALRLTLNLNFPEIDDPRNLCRDVTGLGRWGNGNVQVDLTSLTNLNYVVGLARQSLEKQLGE